MFMFRGKWHYRYFGYTTYLPQNIEIDNLILSNPNCTYYIFQDFTQTAHLEEDYAKWDQDPPITVGNIDFTQEKITFQGDGIERENRNPMVITKKITLRNINPSYKIITSKDSRLTENIPVVKK